MKVDMEKAVALALIALDNPTNENIVEMLNVVNVFETIEESFDATTIVQYAFAQNEEIRRKSMFLEEWGVFARRIIKYESYGQYFNSPLYLESKAELEKILVGEI